MRPDGPPDHAVEALADRVLALLDSSAGPRVLIGITGSPGAGKSTLAGALVAALNARTPGIAADVPMDGFHLANSTLDTLGLRHRKGAIETFDGWGFLALVGRLASETTNVVYAPSFDRRMDEGVTGAIPVPPSVRVVVLEGNYLLADTDPWSRIAELLTESWFCATDPERRLDRLVPRHVAGGRSEEAAHAWATEVDGANAVVIERSRHRADVVISGVTAAVLDA